jgi:hypothetical protein
LVRASAKNIAAYRFPTGDSSELPGYDGILEAEAVPPWVPGGKSVWEFGTGDDPQDKATSDFNKRKKNPDVDVVPAETTFVFVTARVWHDESRARWIEARKGSSAAKALDAGEHRITIATAGHIASLKPQGACLISRVPAGTMSLWSFSSASP